MSVLIHPNEDEYAAQLMVSTTKHYRSQGAEVAPSFVRWPSGLRRVKDMKASTGHKPAVVRWRFHEEQSSRSARLLFMEAKRKHDSQCESCALNLQTWRSRWLLGPPGLQGSRVR